MPCEHADSPTGEATTDAWSRQARRVRLLAGELGRPLDAAALATCDVRDLLALGWALREALRDGRSRRDRSPLPLPRPVRPGEGGEPVPPRAGWWR